MITVVSLQVQPHTATRWYRYCRSVFVKDAEMNCTRIGGPDKIIEVDESIFGRSKYNRGRFISGQWVFGGIDRETRKTFFIPVKNRDAKTLREVLEEWVLPGTTIISDCWKGYTDLEQSGFHHLTVNHSINFVDPITKAHTNTVERRWRDIKETIPKYGRKKNMFASYLAEYQFKVRYPRKSRLRSFFRVAAILYPPAY